MIHELKVNPQFWPSLRSGAKPFEVRRDDRKFRVGDTLDLREYSHDFGYTGQRFSATVTYILAHEDFPNGVAIGYVVLGLGCCLPTLDDGK